MPRLHADADPTLWVPVTGSLGWRGRRHRKAAIRMLLAQAGGGSGGRAGGVTAWAMSQAAPLLMRRADGRVLVWVWKDAPDLLVVMANVQELTPQLRTARAMMPMEYDDTETFRSPYLGIGEKLAMPLPPGPATPPFATYTWDTGTHLVSVTAVCADRERFGTVIGAVDDLARTLRFADDLAIGESAEVLRIDPA
ncbi:hypothetical protein [Microbacterium terricola]|uniref:Cyclophilin TM1367-like domain-containing protein n=1 Tax=Microbacterium terricola TaxID=344163 RepID=A0ABM8E2J4_9MICO|nr:hypothetical protein [Microbacterium terricola]UYK40111.1 hypothetical protein OAU46_00230 [Microbacterium terricola]BDV32187.1 hypothetical protein Microterr_28470 [Microbacterium terricola]